MEKWYVVVTDLVGNIILDEKVVGICAEYDLDDAIMQVISEHENDELAAIAATRYAKESGIPEFGG